MNSLTSKFLFITLFILFTGREVFCSGGKEFKWGKVSDTETSLKSVSYDPEAHAVVLAKTGNLTYFNNNFKIEIYFRIKVLDSEGVSEGDISIPYYSANRLEKIESVKAQTLEIGKDGKVISHKLSKDQIFETKVDEYYSEVRFALPAVKPGTILEYSYTLFTSNFSFLEGWSFQEPIPTLYSYYRVAIPHHLTYNTLMQGGRIYRKYKDIPATNEWELENLPAMKHEPFTYNIHDYTEKVQFQLYSYKTQDSRGSVTDKKVFQGWDSIVKEIFERKEFWDYSHSSRLIKETLAKIPASTDRRKYAEEIYSYVQNSFSWNEYYGLLPDKEVKDLLKEKTGNGAGINLLLVNLLKEAGFEAEAVYLSTKRHGRVNPKIPILTQFNHLNALVKIGKKEHILNAAGNPMPFGILPVQDLNEHALILDRQNPNWTVLKDHSKSYTFIAHKADINKGTYQYNCTWRGFKALEVLNDVQNKNYNKVLTIKDLSLKEDSVKIENSFHKDNSLKAEFLLTGSNKWNAGMIYYDLPLPELLKDNPFKNEIRIFPVDFGYGSTTQLIYAIKIPDGYKLQDQPESILLKLPDNSASFIFQATVNENILNVQVKLDINTPLVPQENYLDLREFFGKMINHCQQPFVFVKAG